MECFLNKSIVDTKQLYKDYTTVRKFTKQRAVYEIDMFFMKVFKMIGDMKKHEKHHGCRMEEPSNMDYQEQLIWDNLYGIVCAEKLRFYSTKIDGTKMFVQVP